MYKIDLVKGVSKKTGNDYAYLTITLHGVEIKRVFLNPQELALVELLTEKHSK